MASVSERPFEALAEVDGRYRSAAFFLGVGAYVLLQVVTALGYRPTVRLFPLVIGVPLLGLIAAKLVLLLFGDRLGIRMADLFEDVAQMEFDEIEEIPDAVRYRREFEVVLWTTGLIVLVWLVGIMPAIAVFVFSFIFAYERSLPRALFAMLLTYGFVYVLFIQILDAVLYEGVYAIRIPGVTA